MTTAGIVVIGNEVLSGKVQEENARFMISELRALGVSLERVVIIRDDVDTIARDVGFAHENFDHVFTSGGVGATHDDVTMRGVAQALGEKILRHPDLEAMLRGYYQDRLNEDVLRMADVPESTELIGGGALRYPVVKVRNIYVLPGVPQFLRMKFEHLKTRFAGADPFVLQQIYVSVGEDRIADLLRRTADALPGLEIGSYPRFDIDEYKVKITVEARDASLVEKGVSMLIEGLDESTVVRVEV